MFTLDIVEVRATNIAWIYNILFGFRKKTLKVIIKISHTYRSEINLNDEHDYSDFVSSFVNHEDIAVYNDGMAIRSFNIFCL